MEHSERGYALLLWKGVSRYQSRVLSYPPTSFKWVCRRLLRFPHLLPPRARHEERRCPSIGTHVSVFGAQNVQVPSFAEIQYYELQTKYSASSLHE